MLTVLLGGARSGKSALAVELARRSAETGSVTFVATATGIDSDMTARIARHRAERPAWNTVEEPIELTAALQAVPPAHTVVVDCLTLWVSNQMFAGATDEAIVDAAVEAAAAAAARSGPTIVVTNEVGLGVHPPSELGRRFQDVLGLVNRRFTSAAASSLLLVAGKAVPLADPLELLA